jgi:hypothetical protein
MLHHIIKSQRDRPVSMGVGTAWVSHNGSTDRLLHVDMNIGIVQYLCKGHVFGNDYVFE